MKSQADFAGLTLQYFMPFKDVQEKRFYLSSGDMRKTDRIMKPLRADK